MLAVRGARDAHDNAVITFAGLAASGFFGISFAAFLKLLLRERFEFETIQFGQDGANIVMIADITGFDPLDD